MAGRVAPPTDDPRMSALQQIAGLPMVKFVMAGHPLDDVEAQSKVIGMAAGAFLVTARVFDDPCVKTPVFRQALANLYMTPGALKFSCAEPKAVTERALSAAFQAGMGLRQRPG